MSIAVADNSHGEDLTMTLLHEQMLSDVLKFRKLNPNLVLPKKSTSETTESAQEVAKENLELEKSVNLLNNLKNSAIINFSKVLDNLKAYRLSLHPSYAVTRLSEDRVCAERLASEAYSKMSGKEKCEAVLAEDGLREDGMIFYINNDTVFWIRDSNRWDFD